MRVQTPPRPRGAGLRRLVAAAAGGVLAVGPAGCGRIGGSASSSPEREPSHHVTYVVYGTGSGAVYGTGTPTDDLDISYSDADGSTRTATAPGSAPYFAQVIDTLPGVLRVDLNASAPSSDPGFHLSCEISVDGVVRRSTGAMTCAGSVDLAAFRRDHPAVSPGTRPTTSAPSSRTTAPDPTPRPDPAGCRFVTAEEVSVAVSDDARTDLPVLGTSGNAVRCNYRFNVIAAAGTITVEWVPHGTVRTAGSTPVPGLGSSATWSVQHADYVLQVQRRTGIVRISTSLLASVSDARSLLVAIYRSAAARLPR